MKIASRYLFFLLLLFSALSIILFYPHQPLRLEKEMAIHSTVLAWEIPWTEESGGLQSMGSLRIKPNSATEHAPLR